MKIYFLVIMCFLSGFISAQDSTARYFTSEVSNGSMDYFIGSDSTAYFGLSKHENYLTLFKFDKSFRLLIKKEFRGMQLNEESYDIYDCRFMNGRVVLFYFNQKKRIRTLIAAEVNSRTLELSPDYHTLASYEGLPAVVAGSDYPDAFTDYDFNITVSSRGKYISVSYVFERKTVFALFNDSLNKQWEVSHDMYFLSYYRDLKVTDDGRIYLLQKNNVVRPQSWMLLEMKKGRLMGFPLDNEEYEFFRGEIGFTLSGQVFITGYYSFFRDEYTTIRNIGTFFFAPWNNKGRVKFTPFSKAQLCNGGTSYEPKKVDKDFKKYECSGATSLYELKLLTDSVGNVYLIGEEIVDKSLGISPAVTFVGAHSIFTVGVTPGERLVYMNILVSVLDTFGNVGEQKWIRKRQNAGASSSYCAVNRKEGINIYFNDNYNNIIHRRDSTSQPSPLSSFGRSVIVEHAIDKSGSLKRGLPFGSSTMKLNAFKSLTYLDRLLLFGTNKADVCMAEL